MDKFGLFFRWRRRDDEIIKTIKERKKERKALSFSLYCYFLKEKKFSSFSSFDHYFFFFSFSYGSIYLSINLSINLTIFFRFLS